VVYVSSVGNVTPRRNEPMKHGKTWNRGKIDEMTNDQTWLLFGGPYGNLQLTQALPAVAKQLIAATSAMFLADARNDTLSLMTLPPFLWIKSARSAVDIVSCAIGDDLK
jgi:hypothetical protein